MEITQVIFFLHLNLILNMSTTIKSFFDRQKRDLSDKSNEDDERKKVRESIISLSKDDTDISEEEIESPRCASILYSC